MESNVPLSIVLPVYNEAGGIGFLIREIVDVLMNGLHQGGEIIVVDDASTDGSATIVETVAGELTSKKRPGAPVEIRSIRQHVRAGQSRALMEGFSAARGDLIVSMDADGQYDPRDLSRFLDAMKSYDMVCGIRRNRRDGFFRKVCSVVANVFRNIVTGDAVADAGCTFRIMRRDCLPSLLPFNGRLEGCEFFFHALILRRNGFRVGEIEVAHRPRAAGRSNYRLVRGRMMRGVAACIKAGTISRNQ